MKIKITEEGQLCRHCNSPVRKKSHPPEWKPSPLQSNWYLWWLICTNRRCHAIYTVEGAKAYKVHPDTNLTIDDQYKQRLEREL